MKNRIYDALSEIKAEEQLKQSTRTFLQEKAYKTKNPARRRLAASFAAVIVLFFAGLFPYNLYFTETAFIDIDVNPGIELTLNRFDRVISVYAYNDDGKKVLDDVDIKHQTYKEALKVLIDKMVEMGYINDAGLFTATIQMQDGASEKDLLTSLEAYMDSVLQADGKAIGQNIFSVDSETKIHSYEQNLTPAKYLAILELQEVEPTATFDGCRDHSISEIKQQVHDHMNDEHNENNGIENGHGNGSGKDKTHETSGTPNVHHETPENHEIIVEPEPHDNHGSNKEHDGH